MSADDGYMPGAAEDDDPFVVRRAKLDSLRAAGAEPYLDRWPVTHRAAEIATQFESLEPGAETDVIVTVAGRLVAKRDQGKVAFLVVRDATGDLQLFCRVNVLGEQGYAAVGELDLGDWVGATGTVVRTRRGELSVAPTEVVLLSKSLRPLPEKFHGLSDTETRYRQRYVDLIANPDVRGVFETRFKIVGAIRRFMDGRGFLEVETPMLQPIPGGATARPFVTHHNALDMALYLRIAPELYLKRLLVGGFERVYEINRSFRNEGMSPRHNPEFTMLEAYQAYTDMNGMLELTESLITAVAEQVCATLELEYQGEAISLASPWRRAPLAELVSEAAGVEVSVHTPREELAALCAEHEMPIEASWGPGKLLNELFEKLVEHTLRSAHVRDSLPRRDLTARAAKSGRPRPDRPLRADHRRSRVRQCLLGTHRPAGPARSVRGAGGRQGRRRCRGDVGRRGLPSSAGVRDAPRRRARHRYRSARDVADRPAIDQGRAAVPPHAPGGVGSEASSHSVRRCTDEGASRG